jgi:hypothetical protein
MRGGPHLLWNVRPIHEVCHRGKGDLTITEWPVELALPPDLGDNTWIEIPPKLMVTTWFRPEFLPLPEFVTRREAKALL